MDLTSGATESSKGTQLVCRLPLAAFDLLTSGCSPRRPAAVIQYGDKGPGATCAHRLFIGDNDHHMWNTENLS